MRSKKIVIIDYKMGNIKSVYNAFKFLNVDVVVSNNKKIIKDSYGIVIPGVGAFGDAVRNLEKLNIFDFLKEEIKNKPYLGICLGLQLLFEKSEESLDVSGFGILKGEVVKFKSKNIKIPHIGWNKVKIIKRNKLFENIRNNLFFYFDHSYYVKPKDKKIISGITDYGEKFVSAVNSENIFGVQFHPEKSQEDGLKILRNFAEIALK